MTNATVDQEKVHAFAGKVLIDTSGLTTTILAALGDRLGLFKALAGHGPATSAELGKAADINERYAREWLGGMASAGYLQYDPPPRDALRCRRSTSRCLPRRAGRCSSAGPTRCCSARSGCSIS